jgi:hypothetical protein
MKIEVIKILTLTLFVNLIKQINALNCPMDQVINCMDSYETCNNTYDTYNYLCGYNHYSTSNITYNCSEILNEDDCWSSVEVGTFGNHSFCSLCRYDFGLCVTGAAPCCDSTDTICYGDCPDESNNTCMRNGPCIHHSASGYICTETEHTRNLTILCGDVSIIDCHLFSDDNGLLCDVIDGECSPSDMFDQNCVNNYSCISKFGENGDVSSSSSIDSNFPSPLMISLVMINTLGLTNHNIYNFVNIN